MPSTAPPMLGFSPMRCARTAIAVLVAAIGAASAQVRPPPRPPAPGDHPNFSGEWRLNRQLSDDAPQGEDNRTGAPGRPRGGFGGFGRRGGFGGRGGYGAPRPTAESPDERAT